MVVMLCMGLYKALGIVKSSEKVFVLKTNSFMLLGSNTLSTGATLSYLLLKIKILIPVKIIGLRSRLKVFTGIKKKK